MKITKKNGINANKSDEQIWKIIHKNAFKLINSKNITSLLYHTSQKIRTMKNQNT